MLTCISKDFNMSAGREVGDVGFVMVGSPVDYVILDGHFLVK